VQAAIGQKTSAEDLGGAKMHSQISGTVDFRELDDESCLNESAPGRQNGRAEPPIFSHSRLKEPLYSINEPTESLQ